VPGEPTRKEQQRLEAREVALTGDQHEVRSVVR
jgi:hypothetical protein